MKTVEVLKDIKPLNVEMFLEQTEKQLNNPKATKYTIQLAAIPRDTNASKYLNMVSDKLEASMVYAQLTNYNGKNYEIQFN
jgi:hypothetical protein